MGIPAFRAFPDSIFSVGYRKYGAVCVIEENKSKLKLKEV
jgi:hypothetical protein